MIKVLGLTAIVGLLNTGAVFIKISWSPRRSDT